MQRYKQAWWLGRLWWFVEPTVWAVAVFRLGNVALERVPAAVQPAVRALWMFPTVVVQLLTGVEIPLSTSIGGGLRIHHGRGLVLNGAVEIGRDCDLRQGVTIGNVIEGGPVPRVGNGVVFGTYAQVFGAVTIGDGARIGSHAVVLKDVPAGATAVGVPARIIVRGVPDAI